MCLIYLRLGIMYDAGEGGDLPDVSDGRAAARGLCQQVERLISVVADRRERLVFIIAGPSGCR